MGSSIDTDSFLTYFFADFHFLIMITCWVYDKNWSRIRAAFEYFSTGGSGVDVGVPVDVCAGVEVGTGVVSEDDNKNPV